MSTSDFRLDPELPWSTGERMGAAAPEPVRTRLVSLPTLLYWVAVLLALTLGLSVARSARAEPGPPLEVGWDYGDLETPRIAALGGAVRAFGNSVDALFTNPAGMAAVPVYHIGGFGEIWPEASRQSYGLAIVDSILSRYRLAGGLGGAWTGQNPDHLGREAVDLRFALALPFSDKFMLGAGGRHLRLRQDGDGPLGPSLVSSGLRHKNIIQGFGLDLGLLLRPVPELGLALTGGNINAPDNGLQPATFGGGIGYGIETFTAEGNLVADFSTWQATRIRAMAGLDFLVGEHYPLRAGYRYDQGAKSHAVSLGLGYLDRVFSLDLAVRRVVSGQAVTAVFFGLVYHVESTGLEPGVADSF